MKKPSQLKALVAACVLAVGTASVAHAQAGAGAGQQAPQGKFQKSEMRSQGKMGMMGSPTMGLMNPRIVEDLNLTDAQKTEYKAIDDFQKEVIAKRKEGFKKMSELRAKQMESGSLDLEALFAADNVERAAAMKDHQEFQGKVLNFWKTLDNDQKAKVSKALADKQERMQQRKDKRGSGPRDGSGPRSGSGPRDGSGPRAQQAN